MSNYTLKNEALAGNDVVVKGDAANITLTKQVVRSSRVGMETVETWFATNITLAREFQMDCLDDPRCSDVVISRQAPLIEIQARWTYDRNDTSWSVPPTPEVSWQITFNENDAPLGTAPYFLNASGAIGEEIARVDYELASTGEASNGTAFTEWIKRYIGLRSSGVETWPEWSVNLVKTTRVYKSTPANVLSKMYYGTWCSFRLQDLYSQENPPSEFRTILEGILHPIYDANGNTDPTGFAATKLVWVKKPADAQLTGNNRNGPRDFTQVYIGVVNAAAVLFPACYCTNAQAGLWDPQNT